MDSEPVNFFKGVGLGTLIGVVFQLGGYLLVRGDRSEFGWVMFMLVPFVSGFAVSAVVRSNWRVLASCLMCLIATYSVMLFFGLEGIICCTMSPPLMACGVAIGAVVGYLVRGRFIDDMYVEYRSKRTWMLLAICPLLVAAADRAERPYRAVQQSEVFTTEAVIDASPERTWELLAEMHHLDGPRPFLLRVGLPVPTRCELDRSAVGGRRVCHFDQGRISQEVVEWRHPSFMALKVTESTLPGRNWLTFTNASYDFIAEGEKTRVVRHTTVGTRLYPRWYWRPFERWGVTSEHEFVFSNLQRSALAR